MSVRLRTEVTSTAAPERVWRELTDWEGQARWIPLTTVRVAGQQTGIGVRAEALSGFWLGSIPVGLLDRFVVTGWTAPQAGEAGELEVLHLGPYFTGEGVFRVEPLAAGGSRIRCTEVFTLPGAPVTEALATVGLPLMRLGLTASLKGLVTVSERS